MPFGSSLFGGSFRKYFDDFKPRFYRDFDTRPTIRDTGKGVVKYGNYSNRRVEPKTYEEIKQECLDEGCLWEDPDFGAEDSSMFYENPPSTYPDIEWLRPNEIVDDPQLFVGGGSRFDVIQGVLGDCWLLAAVACLAQSERLLHRVVPPEQNFTDDYAGVFRFQFWQYGRWVEVVVDDRLPTTGGKLIYMHSDENNEFWTALLEKAYAKLHGSYEALTGGLTSEAMVDFTGGVVERFNFQQELPEDMFHTILKALKRGSMLGCSIDADPSSMEAILDNGLVIGHAYSVTNARQVDAGGDSINLVRVRNPWGNQCEWKGAWSDQSDEWLALPEEEREEMGLSFDHDGEFWMAYDDFSTNFQRVEICYLGPDTLQEGDEEEYEEIVANIQRFEMQVLQGTWQTRVSAGGCANYPHTFWTNPQFKVTITDPDEDDDESMGTLVVGLMQKGRRKLRKLGKDNHAIGYAIYELDDPDCGTLGANFFSSHRSSARYPAFINMREVCGHHRLPPGNYVVVPSTFEPHQECDFLLRVFTETKTEAQVMDEITAAGDPEFEEVPEEEDDGKGDAAQEDFLARAGDDMEIDAYELVEVLNAQYEGVIPGFDGFSIDVCRSLVSMRDDNLTGKLGVDEFKELWEDIRQWKAIFNMLDADGNGYFNYYEFRKALMTAAADCGQRGLRMRNATFNAIVMRYSDKEGHVTFSDFVACVAKIKTMFETFKNKDPDDNGTAEFGMDEFIRMTMYS